VHCSTQCTAKFAQLNFQSAAIGGSLRDLLANELAQALPQPVYGNCNRIAAQTQCLGYASVLGLIGLLGHEIAQVIEQLALSGELRLLSQPTQRGIEDH